MRFGSTKGEIRVKKGDFRGDLGGFEGFGLCFFLLLPLNVFVCASEFRAGRIWGHGLLTFSDGSNSSEGYFQVDYFIGVVVMFLVLVVARRALYI